MRVDSDGIECATQNVALIIEIGEEFLSAGVHVSSGH
jgi:hypothetical protein